MADTISLGLKDILMILNVAAIAMYLFVMFFMLYSHHMVEKKLKRVPLKMDEISKNLVDVDAGLTAEHQNIPGRESEVVMEEAKKISQLWKSRREQMQMGYWEKMEARAEELKKLQEQKEHLEELVRRTKVKYHKREIDEESFRDIVKDYQKQLMEINVKIWELEKALG